jgi:purine nucleosidase/pyrimidine-specific ribonucleoside hydrolase
MERRREPDMTEPRRVVIDTDPGLDDALAILCALASPALAVAGVTTVAGNIGLATTTRNAGRLLALAGRPEVPVIAGAAAPLARPGFDTADIHGKDGLGGVVLPDPAAAAERGAADWLAALLRRAPAGTVDVLALGPLTNLAQLIDIAPDAAARIGRIIAMGGAIHDRGNIGPRSEFNMAADPEAADRVLGAGLDLTLIPLDVTRQVRATPDDCARLRAAARPPAAACAALIEAYFQATTVTGPGRESRPLHDPCVMLLAEAPALFRCERMGLAVDTGRGPDAGALTPAPARPAVSVALGVESGPALALLLERLTSL